MEKLKALIKEKAKQGKFLSDEDKAAKMDILNELKDIAHEAMGKDLNGLKKITVASPTEEGLKEGLKVAEEKVEEKMDSEDSEEEECSMCKEDELCPECKMKEDMMEKSEPVELSKDDKIKKLEEELAALKAEE